ncbi:drug resistance transporter, EmrB/QacA subfamily [Dehalogenimonas formicexedens]|uniref:Drug resistance transporter, EmrB/QacA subfamily n=1 Tax=Dehalogenimonas formicexedens TaxID=1839801 RepID=A0A1P8F7P5_9CHLR|nr:DHA2 family efflux MFS transporter permease subunit [Dehalogenimonas formicexedens]APV44494.1 drug resistance transporter, EmrB/QacA subfamily [Dehalogenimonas formicexedens]
MKINNGKWIALGFLSLSLFAISIDNTILNLALPSIANGLGASATALQWIVDSYLLVFAACLLTFGAIGDRIGRKRMLIGGLAVFGIFSLGAGLASSSNMLITMRALMGVGGAAIMPSTLSILTDIFRQPKERALSIAIWSAVFGLGVGVGPLVGGWLLEHYAWSSIFYINIPVVLISITGIILVVRASRSSQPKRLDILGSLLSAGGLFLFIHGIIQAGRVGWSDSGVVAFITGGLVIFALFGLWERRTKNPMLPLSFFKNMSFSGAIISLTLISFVVMGALFILGQYLQTILGNTPLQTGVKLMPLVAALFLTSVLSAKLAQRMGTKVTVSAGIMLSALGFFYFYSIAAVDTAYSSIAFGMVIIGLGMGLTMSPATNSVMGSIPVDEAGVGSAMNDTTRQIGGAIGVAVIGSTINTNYLGNINGSGWIQALPPQLADPIRSSIQAAHGVASAIPDPQTSALIVTKTNEAFVSGMSEALLVTAIVMVVAAVTAFILMPNQIISAAEINAEVLVPATE